MGLLRRLPLGRWGQASLLVVVGGVVDGLRRLGVGALVEFFFLLLDEGAIAHPMSLVPAMNAAVWDFLPSASVVPAATVGVASIAPPSSIVLRSGVACFIAGDRIHGHRILRLFGLMRPRPIVVVHPLLYHLFESLPFALFEMQYYCIISKSLLMVFGLRRLRYSPHEPRLRPTTAALKMVFSAMSGALAQSLTRRCRYSCKVDPSYFKLWKSYDLTSSGFGARNTAVNSAHRWSQVWM